MLDVGAQIKNRLHNAIESEYSGDLPRQGSKYHSTNGHLQKLISTRIWDTPIGRPSEAETIHLSNLAVTSRKTARK